MKKAKTAQLYYTIVSMLSVGDTDARGIVHTAETLKKLADASGSYLWVHGDSLVAFKPVFSKTSYYD